MIRLITIISILLISPRPPPLSQSLAVDTPPESFSGSSLYGLAASCINGRSLIAATVACSGMGCSRVTLEPTMTLDKADERWVTVGGEAYPFPSAFINSYTVSGGSNLRVRIFDFFKILTDLME